MRKLLAGILLTLGLCATALAGGQPFDGTAFDAASASGKPVLVEVHADWCPVCKRQGPVVQELLSRPQMKNYANFVVDFDSQKDVLKRLNVQRQSTLIVYRGAKEVARSTGETDPQKLLALLEKGL